VLALQAGQTRSSDLGIAHGKRWLMENDVEDVVADEIERLGFVGLVRARVEGPRCGPRGQT